MTTILTQGDNDRFGFVLKGICKKCGGSVVGEGVFAIIKAKKC
jgi:hypothetical protein